MATCNGIPKQLTEYLNQKGTISIQYRVKSENSSRCLVKIGRVREFRNKSGFGLRKELHLDLM